MHVKRRGKTIKKAPAFISTSLTQTDYISRIGKQKVK
jgi:hypothetical protein